MEEFKKLANSRKGYRIHLKKLLSKASDLIERHRNKLSESELPSVTDLCDLRDQLQRKDELISALDAQILTLITDEEQLVTEVCETEDIKESILTSIAHVTHIIDTLSATASETNPMSTQPDTRIASPTTVPTSVEQLPPTGDEHTPPIGVEQPPPSYAHTHVASPTVVSGNDGITRLPKLNIPTFAGDTLEWQSFWDCFDAAVHRNPSITSVQKLNYLRAQLRGAALRVIAGLPLINDNYNHSVVLLKERYGETHKLTDAHMQALVELSSPNNNLSSLQLFYDSVQGHIRSLQSLGTPQDKYESMLVPIILRKLPAEVRKNLARSHGTEKWTLSDLQSSILQELRILEMGTEYPSISTLHTPTGAFLTKTEQRHSHKQHSSLPSKRSCTFCKSDKHVTLMCDIVTDTQKRIEVVRKENLCFNCLGHHKVSQCQSKYRCKSCKRKHHTSLCDTKPTPKQESPTDKPLEPPNTTATRTDTKASFLTPVTSLDNTIHNLMSPSTTKCLLKTAVADVRVGHCCCSANILFDEGAQKSFISQELADQLNIHSRGSVATAISSFGGTSTLNTLQHGNIELITRAGDTVTLSVLVVPKIATPLKIPSLLYQSVQNFPYLQKLDLAHPITHTSAEFEITLLIGADFYWSIVQDQIIRGDGPTAVWSKLGYLLSAPITSSETTRDLQVLHTTIHPIEDNFSTSQFWDVESAGTLPKPLPVNSPFSTYLKSSISRTPDGSIVAEFPWKDDHPPLPSNRKVCEGLVRSLARKLSHTPELMSLYGDIIADQLKRGFIEQVKSSDIPPECHFIPHHPIKKDSVTTPLRIVYDCSCRQSPTHPSLNDCLQAGPPFINDLCAILIRFRAHSIGVITDIEKAFLHVHLAEKDRHFTYFVWLSQPNDPESELIVYRFKVVLFGSVSSPFMLGAALYKLLLRDGSVVAKDIQQNIYVDNVVTGFSTADAATDYYRKSRKIMSTARFNLRSWASNHNDINALAQQDGIADNRTTVNVLGLSWNTDTDMLSLNPKESSSTQHTFITKRDILQDVSRLFDPLGFVTPITMLFKVFLQELWQRKLHWDEPLPDDLREQ